MDRNVHSMMTVEQRAHTAEILTRRLGPEYVASRTGGAAGGLTYLEGSKAFELANLVFGFDGWSTDVKTIDTDFCDTTTDAVPRYTVCVSAIVRVTLRDGSYHEDMGHGKSENQKSKADAFGNAKKTAVTDATKRALRLFGDLLGNCLYDKNYLSKLKGMSKNPPRSAFDRIQRGGVASNVLPITPFPPGQGPVSADIAHATTRVPAFQQAMFPLPAPADIIAAAGASLTDRSQTADAEVEGLQFDEGGEQEIGDGGEEEMDMAGDEYGNDDSGYLEACEQDEREKAKAAAAPRVVSPKSPLVTKKADAPTEDRFAAQRNASKARAEKAGNSKPLPNAANTPVAPRSLNRNVPITHQKIPVVAAGTVASIAVGGSNGKLHSNVKPIAGVSAASRLAPKREFESPSVHGRENRDPLAEIPLDGRDAKRARQ